VTFLGIGKVKEVLVLRRMVLSEDDYAKTISISAEN
jgi:hypothetical protein